MKSVLLVLAAIMAITIFSSQLVSAALISPDENSAKRYVSEKFYQKNVTFLSIKNMTLGFFDGSTKQLFNRICPVGLSWNDTIEACQRPVVITPPPPVVCNPGYHLENGVCVKDPTPVPVGVVPALNVSKNFRIGVVGDVDDNSGIVTQAKLFKKYGVQLVIIPGDLDYNNIQTVFKALAAEGFGPDKLIVADGNHDSCSDITNYLKINSCMYEKYVGPNKEIAIEVLKAKETGVTCSGTEWDFIRKNLEGGDYKYALVALHYPFVTVKSDHPPNGGFSCYNPLFQNNGVNQVIQAHNHNYQFVMIGKVIYGVYGTGTHDTGSAMYGCDSSTFNNIPVLCKTGTNGVTIEDFQIDNPAIKHMDGYFVSNADKLVHSFGGSW